MGTRIIQNGKPVWGTRDMWLRKAHAPFGDPDKIQPVIEERDLALKRVGEPYYDREDDLNYLVVQYLDPRQGWCFAAQLCDFYRVSYRCLLDWARHGYLKPAMELNSPTKRFQVRAPALLPRLAEEWRAKQPPERLPLEEVRARARRAKK